MSNTGTNIILQGVYGDYFPQLLKARHDAPRLYDPDYALNKDYAAYEKMLRDPIIRQALQIRYKVAAGGTWSCIPARDGDEKDMLAAEVMTACLGQISAFQNARSQLASAIFRGLSFARVEGTRALKRFGDDKPREWWCPSSLKNVDKRMVRLVPRRGDATAFESDLEIFQRDGTWAPLQRNEYVHVEYDGDQSRIGFGRGLSESVYFYFYAKLRALEQGLKGMERWAQGIIVGKVDNMAFGDATQSSQNTRDEMDEVINKLRGEYGATIGKEDEIEFHETSGSGHEIVTSFLAYCDQALTRVITGSNLPAGGGADVGSNARAQVEMDVSESIAQIDSEVLDEAVTNDVLRQCWELNQEPLAELGLQEAEMPVFKSENEQKENTKENAERAAIVLLSGAPIKADEYYEKVGFSKPSADDEVIRAPQQEETEPGSDKGKQKENDAGMKAHAITDDIYIPSAAAFAALFGSLGDDDGLGFGGAWFALSLRKFKGILRRLARSIASRMLGKSVDTPETREVWQVIADAMAAADLEGRSNILDIAHRGPDPIDAEDVSTPESGLPEGEQEIDSTREVDTDAPPTTVPKIPFGEAVSDVAERIPEVATSAEAVAQAYRDGPAFALAKSVDEQVTAAVQKIVKDTMQDGKFPRDAIEEIAAKSENFTDSYAETVLRTNVATARTQGMFEQAKDPNFRAVIPAFQFSATKDRVVRRGRDEDHGENHLAADGLIAAIDDPIWMRVAPPVSYRCRCSLFGMTKGALRRHKEQPRLDEDGNVIPYIPKGFDKFSPHPNFRRNKMPGA